MPRGKGRGCGEAACTRQDGEEDLDFLDFENKIKNSTSKAAIDKRKNCLLFQFLPSTITYFLT